MNDIFSAFGFQEEELEAAMKEDKKKGKDTKKEKKSGSKKSSNKSTKTYKLPIKVCGGHIQHIFRDENESVTTWTEDALKNAIKEQFRELAEIYFGVAKLEVENKEDGISSYVKLEVLYKELEDADKLEFPVDIVAGETNLWLDTPISLEEVRELWVAEHPEYKGCKFQYDEKQKILLPYMEANAARGRTYQLPITVGYLQIQETYETEDFEEEEVSEDDIREKYAGKYPEFTNCEFAYQEEINLLFPISKKTGTTGKSDSKISLPVEVRAGGFNLTIEEKDLEGKKVATLEEIRQVLEKMYPEYAKERTTMVYDDKHFVVPILKSSTKGIRIVSQNPSWCHEVLRDGRGHVIRVESRPFGVFTHDQTEDKMSFEMKAPKISQDTMETITKLFRQNPNMEFAVQIFYNGNEKTYEIYVPQQKSSESTVFFERCAELEQEKTLMMDVHSHGVYPAFFSAQDNADEQGVRLYMVIGNLDCEDLTYKLRAGLAGNFLELPLSLVFKM